MTDEAASEDELLFWADAYESRAIEEAEKEDEDGVEDQ